MGDTKDKSICWEDMTDAAILARLRLTENTLRSRVAELESQRDALLAASIEASARIDELSGDLDDARDRVMALESELEDVKSTCELDHVSL